MLVLVFSLQGETDQALAYLETALSVGEPEGFIRVFVDEGPPMARLFYEALSRGIAPDYVPRLLAVFPDAEPEQPEPPSVQISETDLFEPLSERELEVLRLIAQLLLSLNTVKAHTRSIYGKPSVYSHTQAIARSQALGILRHQ